MNLHLYETASNSSTIINANGTVVYQRYIEATRMAWNSSGCACEGVAVCRSTTSTMVPRLEQGNSLQQHGWAMFDLSTNSARLAVVDIKYLHIPSIFFWAGHHPYHRPCPWDVLLTVPLYPCFSPFPVLLHIHGAHAAVHRVSNSHWPVPAPCAWFVAGLWVGKSGSKETLSWPKHCSIAQDSKNIIWLVADRGIRRKFRSQISDNMDRWKSRVGKSQRIEETRRRGKIGERMSQKKEDARERKSRQVAVPCVFPMVWGSRGSKGRLYRTLHHTKLIPSPQMQLQLHYTNCTTPQLQLHSLQSQQQLHYTTTKHPAVVDEVTDQVTTATIVTTPKNTTTFQSISGFALPSVIHDNQALL